MIQEIRRFSREGGFYYPLFQARYYDRVLLMDPTGFQEWMSQQEWPETGEPLKFGAPQALLPDSDIWKPVEFQIGRIHGGITVIAHANGKTLYDGHGDVINVVVPTNIS